MPCEQMARWGRKISQPRKINPNASHASWMAGLLLSRLAGSAFTSNTRIRNTPAIAIICLFSLCG